MKHGHWDRHPHVRTGEQLLFRERAADLLKRSFGTWTALFVVAAWIAVWMLAQKTSARWDPAPYILLNLCLSCLAAVQGIILQISANRGDRISSEVAMSTHDNSQKLLELTSQNATLIEQNTALTQQIRDLTEQVHVLVTPKTRMTKTAAGSGK